MIIVKRMSEPAQKRIRLVRRLDQPFDQFVYPDGSVVPFDELFSGTNGEAVMMIIMELPKEKALTVLGSLGGGASQWIRRQNIWMRLFAKHYPETFMMAVDPTTGRMKFDVKVILDTLSVQPRRQDTYWKRYMEYIIKTERYLDSLPAGFGPMLLLNGQFDNYTSHVDSIYNRMTPEDMHNAEGYQYNNANGFNVYKHPDPTQWNVVYVTPSSFYSISQRYFPQGENRHAVNMHEVTLSFDSLRGSSRSIPYDRNMLGKLVHNRTMYSHWLSPDKFTLLVYSSGGVLQMRPATYAANTINLVSSPCTLCLKRPAQFECKDCREPTRLCNKCAQDH